MRIKKNQISFTHSPEFEHIIIIPNTEENMNLVVLIPRNPADTDTVNHQTIR